MKTILQLITIFCTLGWLSGCTSAGRPGHVTFNPEAVYRIPASGKWMEGLIDADTGRIQGKMYVPPGCLLEPSFFTMGRKSSR